MTQKPTAVLTPQKNVAIAPFTSFGIGGKAKYLIETKTPTELVTALNWARQEKIPYFIIAGGSNIVASDKVFPGVVIIYRNKEAALEINTDKLEIVCAGSISLGKLVDASIDRGWQGLESLAGIPGTVAGAIFGNAGAYGHSTAEAVSAVLIYDGKKERWLSRGDCQFGYRTSIFKKKNWQILAARFVFNQGDKEKLIAGKKSIIDYRNTRYANIKCPGSFFQNVLAAKVGKRALAKIDQTKIIDGKIPAGYLLEAVGAKGMQVGGLRIADYHGNLIINNGQATYKDVQKLVKILKEKVSQKFGIELEEEVRYLI